MKPLFLHDLHQAANAQFTEVNGMEVVAHYGDVEQEYRALREGVAIFDLGFRSRLSVTGADRRRFLNGQVTNHVAALNTGQGCYAALVTAKGKIESDLNIWACPSEFLLDFEPGLTAKVCDRLQKYIIADDVEVRDIAATQALLSLQGPSAPELIEALRLPTDLPETPMTFQSFVDPDLGELHPMNLPRSGNRGFDFYLPAAAAERTFERLRAAAQTIRHASLAGWLASEALRIEAGIPRYGADMDDTNFPAEAGIEDRAVSYSKGCYIGQEIIARIRTYGQVNRHLKGFILSDALEALPVKGDRLLLGGKEVGMITSAAHSPGSKRNIALGYLRREITTEDGLHLSSANKETAVRLRSLGSFTATEP